MARILDSEKIRQKVTSVLNKVKDDFPDQTMFNRLTDAQTEILKEIDANVKLVVLEGTPRQQFLYLMAGYLVEGDDRKMWYIYHAIMSIIVIQVWHNTQKNEIIARPDRPKKVRGRHRI